MVFKFLPRGQHAPTPFDPGTEEFLRINVENLANRLDLKKIGVERGGNEQPRSADENLDDIELSIAREIHGFGGNAHSSLLNHLASYRARMEGILSQDSVDRVRGFAQSTTTKMIAQVRAGTGVLFNRRRDLVLSDRDLNGFMETNQLTRPASYPQSHFFLFSLLVLLLVIESGFNAFLIGEASEFGVLGGFVEMIAISLVNLIMGFAIGHFVLPQFSRRSFLWRLIFLVVFLVGATALASFNLFVGHYRDVISVAPSDFGIVDFGAQALQRVLREPLGLQDFKSWLFMMMGLIFSAAALIDGWKWDDPYPGYGPRDRQHKQLVNDYGRLYERLQQTLVNLVEECKAEIDEIAQRASQHKEELITIQRRANDLREKLRRYYDQLEIDGQYLLQVYRQANLAARSSDPPGYFNTKFVIAESERPIPDAATIEGLDVESLRNVTRRARQLIEKTHRELLDVYETINQLTEEELEKETGASFSERLENVERTINESADNEPDSEVSEARDDTEV